MTRFRRFGALVAAAAVAVSVAPLAADAGVLVTPNPYELGPAPTAENVQVNGPFEVAVIPRTQQPVRTQQLDLLTRSSHQKLRFSARGSGGSVAQDDRT